MMEEFSIFNKFRSEIYLLCMEKNLEEKEYNYKFKFINVIEKGGDVFMSFKEYYIPYTTDVRCDCTIESFKSNKSTPYKLFCYYFNYEISNLFAQHVHGESEFFSLNKFIYEYNIKLYSLK